MVSYLIRRILLFIPTLIGATALIFLVMFLSPNDPIQTLLPPTGDMRPGEREAKEEYIRERYGLDQPAVVQYLRWLNNVSPIGLQTWSRADDEVRQTLAERRTWRAKVEAELREQHPDWSDRQIREARTELEQNQDFAPLPGDFRYDKVPIKAPDLGDSFVQARPVGGIILEALPKTLLLQALSLPISVGIAIVSGVWAARHRGRWQDWLSGTLLLGLYSLPVIWVGVMLIGFLANVEFVRAFPAQGLHGLRADDMTFLPRFEGGFQPGYLLDTAWHLVLPILCISYGSFAYYSKLTRTSLLETLNADFVRTARAKGLAENVVLWQHAFRNALMPLITVAAGFLPILITGSIVVETIFGIEGMGRLVITSLKGNDRELFLSVSVVTLILQLLGFLLADLAYALADPRVSYDTK